MPMYYLTVYKDVRHIGHPSSLCGVHRIRTSVPRSALWTLHLQGSARDQASVAHFKPRSDDIRCLQPAYVQKFGRHGI